jgi:hypothetical protein
MESIWGRCCPALPEPVSKYRLGLQSGDPSCLALPGDRSGRFCFRPYGILDSAVTGKRMCLVACGFSVCSTEVPSYAAAKIPLGVLRRSICSGGFRAPPASELCELYELCLDKGWAYCCGRECWARLRPSKPEALRRSGGWDGDGGRLLYMCGGCGWGGYCRTMVMMDRAPEKFWRVCNASRQCFRELSG